MILSDCLGLDMVEIVNRYERGNGRTQKEKTNQHEVRMRPSAGIRRCAKWPDPLVREFMAVTRIDELRKLGSK
jgi:hypothetical protein